MSAGAAVKEDLQVKDRQCAPTHQSDFRRIPCSGYRNRLGRLGIGCARAPGVVASAHWPKLTTLLAGSSVARRCGGEPPESSLRGLSSPALAGMPSSASRSARLDAEAARGAGIPVGRPHRAPLSEQPSEGLKSA
jgi:hypothetical protein